MARKFAQYCTCGGVTRGRMATRDLAVWLADWEYCHRGPGHAPCDAKTAATARAKGLRRFGYDPEVT